MKVSLHTPEHSPSAMDSALPNESELSELGQKFSQSLGEPDRLEGGQGAFSPAAHKPFSSQKEKGDGLEAMFSHMRNFSFDLQAAAVEESRSGLGNTIPEPILKMVDRILVEVPGTTHRQEVRIQISNDVLPETEIRIFREGGQLEVGFVTKSQDAHNALSGHLQSLQDVLEDRQGEPVRVFMEYASGSDAGSNDGRSRQRHMPWEDWNENDT